MKGTIVNAVAVLGGTCLGAGLKRGFPEKYRQSIMQALALCVLLIGMMMAVKTENILIVILSLIIGAIIGEFLAISAHLEALGQWINQKCGGKDAKIGQAFVTASLVFCVGAMAVVGSLQEGLTGDPTTLYAKSMLDGIASVIFSATLGIGVGLSSLTILLYQGTITAIAGFLSPFLSEAVIHEMTAVGGILIMAIGLIMLEIKEIPVANWLPAIPAALVLTLLWPF
ncbi:MAG: DUF554 domain-containing protein [Sporomusaceae bacterium]|nr:DUF554 domain-containing protein [Sporomusaceae bacterium]